MGNLFIVLKEYLDKREEKKHTHLKVRIKALQEIKGIENMLVKPDKKVIAKCERRIKKLQRALNKSHMIYCL